MKHNYGKMISVLILNRHRDENGYLIGYDIKEDDRIKMVPPEYILNVELDNAILVGEGCEVRAKPGCKIGTVVRKLPKIEPVQKLNGKVNNCTQSSEPAYHGMDFISACKNIRTCARGGRLTIDRTEHLMNAGNNVRLFKVIEECGYSLEEFIGGYLSCIQPYSMEKFKGKIGNGDATKLHWMLGVGYRHSLLIKVTMKGQFDAIVVSFHESNINNVPTPRRRRVNPDDYCAVIVENVRQREGVYEVDYVIQHGFIRLTITSMTRYYRNGVALVRYKEINDRILTILDQFMSKMLEIYGGDNHGTIKLDNVDCLSIMANGFATINNLCMVIDLYSEFTDVQTRKLISTIAEDIVYEIEDSTRKRYLSALTSKYGINYNNNLYACIVRRLEG